MKKNLLFIGLAMGWLVAFAQTTISGPTTATTGQQSTYSVNTLAQNSSWSISPGGNIFSGQGTHSITVHWNSAGSYTISYFENGNLLDTHQVSVTQGSGGGSSSPWTEVNNEVYYTGNVGIGNTNPAYKLDVSGTTRISGSLLTSDKIQVDGNTVIDNNAGWHRSYGSTGWYNGTHGGGIYMQDGTWIRTYGNKSFYHNTGTMRTDGTFQVGPGGDRFYVNTSGNSALSGNFSAGGIITAQGGNSNNWNTAYTWGDHASAGYYKSGSNANLGNVDANYFDVKAGHGRGLRFWNSNDYKIHMGNVSENHYGPVQDYSIKMNMNNNANRGWTWGVSGATPVAAINTQGHMQIKGDFTTEGKVFIGSSDSYFYRDQANRIATPDQFYVQSSSPATYLYSTNTYLGAGSGDNIHLRGNTFSWTSGGGGIINASGNVGIGTTAPASGYKLDVNGAIKASGGNSNNWNTAYTQRGSQIAGTGLNWSGGKLNVTGVNTDDQVIDVFSLSGTTLSLSLESDGQATKTVNLASINTDNQDLTLSGNILSLTNDATTVDLSSFLDNTDNQSAGEVPFTSISGLTASDVSAALDEINTRINNSEGGIWTETSGNISFSTGQVSIGTVSTKTDYELSVGGEIVAEEVLIQFEGDWPDYVFDEKYKLLSILDLKAFIQENHHLPNVPSAEEVKEEGIEVGEMNKILLEKIEELTLYMIRQSEEIELLKKKLEQLEERPSSGK